MSHSPHAPIDRVSLSRRWLPLAILALGAAAAYGFGAHHYLSFAAIIEHRNALHSAVAASWIASLAVYSLIYLAMVTLSVPGAALLTLLGGFLFGWLAAGLCVVVAATAGASIIFLVARTSLGDLFARRAGPRLRALAIGFRSDAFNYLLFLRLVPAFPFWLVNIAPGLLGVRLRTYVAATFIGIIPGTFAYAFIGSGLDSTIEVQQKAYESCLAAGRTDCRLSLDAGALMTTELMIAFVVLGLLALLPVAMRRLRPFRGFGGGGAE